MWRCAWKAPARMPEVGGPGQVGEGKEEVEGKSRGRAEVPRYPHLVEHLYPRSLDSIAVRHGDRGFRWSVRTGKQRKKGGGGGSRKLFTLRLLAPSKQDGSIPREIDAFLKSLRNHPLWVRDFLSIELTDIKRGTNTRLGITIRRLYDRLFAEKCPGVQRSLAKRRARARRNINDSIRQAKNAEPT